jgi:hypothetical protein
MKTSDKWSESCIWHDEKLSIMSFAKGLLHVNILVYLIEGDENPCEMECFKLIGFQCNNVGWLLSYPIEKCSWVVLQLNELYSFGPIWVFPHKDEIQSFVVTRVMQDKNKTICLVDAHFVWGCLIDMKTQSVVVSACVLVIHERKSWQPQQTDVHLLFPYGCSYQIKH